ncbi:MAG: toll/interleukin-1 receptor domain-containing protein [Gammaproteobacteria bacterium]
MEFEKHLFISYAHLDDVKADDDPKGWVGQFHSSLASFLSTALGQKPVIWRDVRLEGHDDFSAEIVDQFSKTAVMVSVLSERYLESEWCLREVTEFCKAAEATGGLIIDNKMRVHQVIIRPLGPDLREKLPDKLKAALGYPFYKEEEDGGFMPLDPRFGDEYRAAFKREIFRLADDMAKMIKKLIGKAQAPAPTGPPKPTVYLAECSWDRADDREKIRSELRATGYNVLPDQGARLPEAEPEYVAEVGRLLDQCRLSLHVVGGNAAKVPDGPGRKDAVQLQNDIGAKKSEQHGLPRIIWLPVATSAQPDHQAFIDALRSKAELQRGGDLIEDTLERFKDAVRVALKKLEEPSPQKVEAVTAGPRLVYVICVANDRPATVPLRKSLRAEGLEVLLPVFEGDAATVRQADQELLVRCDAAIVFYGAGDEAWTRTVESDLQKSKSARGSKPLLASVTWLASPVTAHKTDCLEMGEPNMINALEAFPQTELAALVTTLKAGGK